MQIQVELTREKIHRPEPAPHGGVAGAWAEFTGIVRNEEAGARIVALEYEAYDSMAQRVMHELLAQLGKRHRCQSAHVIHRVGLIPVGEAAIWVGVAGAHRQPAFALVTEFMERLKQDVPIWKRGALATSRNGDPQP